MDGSRVETPRAPGAPIALLMAGVTVLAAACDDITGLDERPLAPTWLEFPAVVEEDSDFPVRVVAPLSGCDRVSSIRVSRRDTAFLVTARVEPSSQVCTAEIAELDTMVSAESGGPGRFVIVSSGRTFGRLEVIDPDEPDTLSVRGLSRGGGEAVPVRVAGCVLLQNPAGLSVPRYPTTGAVAVPDTVVARGFVQGTLLGDPPPAGCPRDLPLFRVEALELELAGSAARSGVE